MISAAGKTKKVFDGRYEILSIVGRGARSVVYHARHLASPANEVALKVLIDQKGKSPSSERLRREALAMVSCRHKYVVRLDDFHSVGSLCYLSMEYAPESDLRSYMAKQGGCIQSIQAERFLKQSVEALAFIHNAGIVHRDIKPENLLVMNDKEVRITDFGVALLPGEQCSIADLQSGVGTMNYMAPEIIEGKAADMRSDIYALGIVFYEALGGVNPFEGIPLAQQIEIRENESYTPLRELAPETPAYLEEILSKAMKFSPEKRFSSATELLRALLDNRSAAFGEEKRNPVKRIKNIPSATSSKAKSATDPANKKAEKASTGRLISSKATPTDTATAAEPKVVDFKVHIKGGKPKTTHPASNLEEMAKIALGTDDKCETIAIYDRSAPEPRVMSVNAQTSNVPAIFRPAPPPMRNNSEIEEMGRRKTVVITKEEVEHIRNEASHSGWLNNLIATDKLTALMADTKHRRVFKVTALVVSLLLFFGIFLGDSLESFAKRHIRPDLLKKIGLSLSLWDTPDLTLPNFQQQEYSFPTLPSGVYQGSLKGLLPGKAVPLSLISFEEQDNLVVIVGIEGWTPAIVKPRAVYSGITPPASANGPDQPTTIPLRVASNGIILRLTAQVVDGTLVGYFTNVVTGQQGEWSATAAQAG